MFSPSAPLTFCFADLVLRVLGNLFQIFLPPTEHNRSELNVLCDVEILPVIQISEHKNYQVNQVC